MSTYLRRRGRITRGQARALESWAQLIVPADAVGPVDWNARFGRAGPLGVEIGFGMGQALLEWAEAQPEVNLVGIDVYRPGIGSLLLGRSERNLEHLQVIEGDARIAMEGLFDPGTLSEVRIFFPDPWPKKRHHKRRLISAPFVELLASRLRPGALLRLATDWEPYAEQMLEVLDAQPQLSNVVPGGGFAPRFEGRNPTRFESRGARLGHPVRDLCFQKDPV